LESIKAVVFYDLREQNKKFQIIKNNSYKEQEQIIKNNSFKEQETDNLKDKNKFITGKYKFSKGKSLLGGRNCESIDFLEFSGQENLKKIQKHMKNQTGSGDLKNFSKKPINLNPLYLLTQSNLTFKKKNLKVFKGFSGNFGRIIHKEGEMNMSKQFSNTFLEINSMKVSIPLTGAKSSNSFKITTTSLQKINK